MAGASGERASPKSGSGSRSPRGSSKGRSPRQSKEGAKSGDLKKHFARRPGIGMLTEDGAALQDQLFDL